VSSGVSFACTKADSSAAAGLVYASGAYGYAASRTFLGRSLSQRFFGPKFSWQAWFNLPVVLPLLILSRTSLFESILPLLPLSILCIPPPLPFSSLARQAFISGVPSPTSILISLPWIRLLYRRLRVKLATAIMRGEAPLPNQEGEDDIMLEMAGDAPDQQEPNARMQIQETLTFGSRAVSRLFLGSLLLPFVSQLSGQILLKIAHVTRSKVLRWALGLQDDGLWNLALNDSDYMLRGGPARVKGASVAGSWTDRVKSFVAGAGQPGRIDPIWWRTTLGGCVFVVLKDTFSVGLFREELV
jgi:hypothetical protein